MKGCISEVNGAFFQHEPFRFDDKKKLVARCLSQSSVSDGESEAYFKPLSMR